MDGRYQSVLLYTLLLLLLHRYLYVTLLTTINRRETTRAAINSPLNPIIHRLPQHSKKSQIYKYRVYAINKINIVRNGKMKLTLSTSESTCNPVVNI